MYNLSNIKELSIIDNPVKYSKIIGGKKWNTHKLENDFKVELSNGMILDFRKGWKWDRASVPQLFHSIIRPDGDDDIAYCIHDFLYVTKRSTRKFADKEMLKWAKAMKGTERISWRNWDIITRYRVLRLLGGLVW